jgi:hypothetical protein
VYAREENFCGRFDFAIRDFFAICFVFSLRSSKALLAERHAERLEQRTRLFVVARGGDD